MGNENVKLLSEVNDDWKLFIYISNKNNSFIKFLGRAWEFRVGNNHWQGHNKAAIRMF